VTLAPESWQSRAWLETTERSQ